MMAKMEAQRVLGSARESKNETILYLNVYNNAKLCQVQ